MTTMTFKKFLPLVVLTTVLLGFGAQTASADTLLLNVGNAGAGGPGPYASLDYSLINANTATFTFTALNNHLLTDGGAVALNVSGPFSWDGTATTTINQPTVTSQGSGTEDGFGTFNFRLTVGDSSPTSAIETITFTLTNASGWANTASILTPNNDTPGRLAAAHVGLLDSSGAFSTTGFATNGPASVPDGGTTASLLGLALAVGGLVTRRRK